MEEFIGMIRQLPCLWDTAGSEYRDMAKRDAAWRRIVKELKSKNIPDIKTAKSEWKKLRDCHRDSMKRSKTLKGYSVNKWRYAELMQFLLPYMKSRKKKRRLSASSEEHDETSLSPSDSFLVQPSTSSTDNFNFIPDCMTRNTDESESDHKYKKRKIESEFGEVMINIDDRTNQYTETNKHPLDSFFESMCETTKQFPTWLQYSVKRKIFNVISEAEDTFETYKSREPIY